MESKKFLEKDIKKIINNFKNKKTGIFPTDTVYGIGGRANSSAVIKKVYKLKKRAKSKPLLILVSSISMAKRYVKINKKQELLLKKYWPGQVTVILADKGVLSIELSSGTNKIGIRLPNNKFLLKTIRGLGAPLIATSANISGQGSVLDVKDIKIKADFIVDGGELPKSKESTVIDLTGDKMVVLRQGVIKIKKII